MAQGEAISVLLRAHALDSSSGYGDAAERASRPFLSDIGQGGVVWRSGAELFLEEIANEHAPHVLNGCIFALWGIWELWKRTGDRELARIIEACVDTLRRWLPRFDTGWWTRYSLLLSAGDQPHIATLKYHQFHIAQMHVLAQMFSEPRFEEAARRWTSYVGDPASRARVIEAALRSLPERLSRRDTVLGGAHT
jgi:heparosan-N-sulfate-glucuronate 5-epimerase